MEAMSFGWLGCSRPPCRPVGQKWISGVGLRGDRVDFGRRVSYSLIASSMYTALIREYRQKIVYCCIPDPRAIPRSPF